MYTTCFTEKTTLQQEAQQHWHLIIAAVSCMFTILLFIGVLHSKLRCVTSCCSRTLESTENGTPGPRIILSLFPKTRQPQSIRNHSTKISLSPRTLWPGRTELPVSAPARKGSCRPTVLATTKVHSTGGRPRTLTEQKSPLTSGRHTANASRNADSVSWYKTEYYA
jgi:hypothetical protein